MTNPLLGANDAKTRPKKEGQEDLEEVVDELKNDLRVREQELDELRLAFAKLERENK